MLITYYNKKNKNYNNIFNLYKYVFNKYKLKTK